MKAITRSVAALMLGAPMHRCISHGSVIKRLATMAGIGVLFAGCAFFPVANRTVPVPQAAKADVLELAIDAARSVDLPPPTKVDKANGVVEFGAFGRSEIGYTAQVRVRSDGQLDVSVQRGSIYVPLEVNEKAQEFVTALESRMQGAK